MHVQQQQQQQTHVTELPPGGLSLRPPAPPTPPVLSISLSLSCQRAASGGNKRKMKKNSKKKKKSCRRCRLPVDATHPQQSFAAAALLPHKHTQNISCTLCVYWESERLPPHTDACSLSRRDAAAAAARLQVALCALVHLFRSLFPPLSVYLRFICSSLLSSFAESWAQFSFLYIIRFSKSLDPITWWLQHHNHHQQQQQRHGIAATAATATATAASAANDGHLFCRFLTNQLNLRTRRRRVKWGAAAAVVVAPFVVVVVVHYWPALLQRKKPKPKQITFEIKKKWLQLATLVSGRLFLSSCIFAHIRVRVCVAKITLPQVWEP